MADNPTVLDQLSGGKREALAGLLDDAEIARLVMLGVLSKGQAKRARKAALAKRAEADRNAEGKIKPIPLRELRF